MIYKRKDGSEIEFTTLLENSKKADTFKHFKEKNYQIVTIAKNSEDDSLYVAYKAMYGKRDCYIRPAEMFFSKVDKEKYPLILQEYRFEKVKR